ncbi:MAG: Omp28-related outer membrane protein [Prevotella sp.]|nr:Omp28-related outer membrane protein [Prevotella sp.]
MSKFYKSLLLVTICFYSMSVSVMAQNPWNHHSEKRQAVYSPEQGTDELHVPLGYASPNDYIYEYDGLSVDEDQKVGCAILVTAEMLQPYAGGEIVAMLAGWDTSLSNGDYSCFVRKGFLGEKVAGNSTAKNVGLGWNKIDFDQTYVIPETPENLLAGFYVDLKKDVISIPTLYPRNVRNSNYLWRTGEVDDNGNEVWSDFNSVGTLPIILIVKDTEGKFTSMVSLNSLLVDKVVLKDSTLTAIASITNKGSEPVKTLEVTTVLGEQQLTHEFTLSSPVAQGSAKRISVPVKSFGSGTSKVYISGVNGKPNGIEASLPNNIIAVPKEVADRYNFVPVVEYFESENSYKAPRYYEEILAPGLENYKDRMIFVSQHMDDQYATGDDDATKMSLDFCNNDSLKVELPCMGVNRTYYSIIGKYIPFAPATPLFSVMYPQFAAKVYDFVLQMPTFASVSGTARHSAEEMSATIKGDIATGIMPENEDLYLTVYLMERDVESNSQMFWSDDEEEAHQGKFVHKNIIREILSEGIYGDRISGDGSYEKTYATELDPSWNAENLYVVAFLNRGLQNNNFERQIINASEIYLSTSTGISVTNAGDKEKQPVYDLYGRRVSKMSQGIYISNGKKFVVR